jgi:large subunit ribosomal protein L17
VKKGPRKGDAAPMAIIELVEELEVVAPKAPRQTARKAAKADSIAVLAGEEDADETPVASETAEAKDDDETKA